MKRRRKKDLRNYFEARLKNIEHAHHELVVDYQQSRDTYIGGLTALSARVETQLEYLGREFGSLRDTSEANLDDFKQSQGAVNSALHDEILTVHAESISFVENRVTSLNEALVGHMSQTASELRQSFNTDLRDSLDESREAIDESREAIGRIFGILDNFRVLQQGVRQTPSSAPTSVQPSASNQSAFDSTLYADFELRFRGSQGDIKERFSCYRDVLDLIPRSGHEFLDLGCGRGEFLEFLSQHQVACSGVDSDEIAVEQCMRKGLRAQVGDLVSYLSGLEEHSVSGVSLLHVIEHLPVQTALDVLREAHRVITPEGIVIVETPNPKNLRVGSSNFWLDPTHLRPYPPELTGFMIETVGFVQSSTKFLRSNLGLYDVDELEPQLKVLFDVILTAIDGPADYAIVAKKSARIYS